MRRLSVLATLLAICCASPAAAAPTQRFAAPGGSGDCSQSSPCDIETAINAATSGDEVILAPGDYGPLTAALASTQTNLNVHGAGGQPRPRIFTNALFGLDLGGSGSTARHLEIHQSANGSYQSALVLESGQATDLVLRNIGGSSGAACTLLGTSQLTDSVCEATGPNAYGVFPYRRAVGPLANSSIVRNATVVAPVVSSTGIYAQGGDAAEKAENLTVTNTIIVAGGTSVAAFAGTGDASITIDHSNFGFQSDLAHIHKGEGNQQLSTPPTFVAPGDYHEAPGSITIDAGATNPLNGLTDFDGDPRALGLGGTDIGADEFVPPPTVVTGEPGTITTTSAVVNGTVNPNTVETTYHFEFGATTAYGAATPEGQRGLGSDARTGRRDADRPHPRDHVPLPPGCHERRGNHARRGPDLHDRQPARGGRRQDRPAHHEPEAEAARLRRGAQHADHRGRRRRRHAALHRSATEGRAQGALREPGQLHQSLEEGHEPRAVQGASEGPQARRRAVSAARRRDRRGGQPVEGEARHVQDRPALSRCDATRIASGLESIRT